MNDERPFWRGVRLRELGREEEAVRYFREALAVDPNNALAHCQLALCLDEIEGARPEALEAIGRAIALEPEEAVFHVTRADILCGLRRGDAALAAGKRAVALEPESDMSHTAVARAHLVRERWAEAEEAARKALVIDGDSESALALLAVSLRMQGRREEDEVAVARLLSENPEDKYAHVNAGHAALRRLDHKKAEGHFREALRLDAEFEPAREGLVDSFRARSGFYRTYLRYCFWMSRFTRSNRWVLVVGLYLAFRFGRAMAGAIHPALAGAVVVVYLAFLFWVWLANGIGGFLIYCDRSVRPALKRSERLEALAVGGGFIAGLAILAVAGIMKSPAFAFAGGALALGALPASLVFTNASNAGRAVFGSVFAAVYIVGFGGALTYAFGGDIEPFLTAATFAALATMLCTWFGNVQALRA